jgi:hypothetical protein
MEEHTTRIQHTLGLDKMLGEKKVLLDGKELILICVTRALAEAQPQGPNP